MNEIEKAQQEITEAREKLTSAEARLSALSKVEKEYRAGEWVPCNGDTYYFPMVITHGSSWDGSIFDKGRLKSVGVYPTEAIAEAAKAHAAWWREFDMSDEGGNYRVFVLHGKIEIGPYSGYDGCPCFKTRESARVAIERLGGEQKVIEMLNKGRVFRFTWGGQ